MKGFQSLSFSKWLPCVFLLAIITIICGDLSPFVMIQQDAQAFNKRKAPNSFYPTHAGKDGEYWPIVPDEHWDFIPRIYSTWNSTSSWCASKETFDNRTPAGLIYLKVHKAASSTLSGVNLRIANNYGRRASIKEHMMTNTPCASFEMHDDSHRFRYRARSRSFMYTSIRDPTHRALSWIFYLGSNCGSTLDDDYIFGRLKARDFYVPKVPRQLYMNTTKYDYYYEAGAQVGYMHTGPSLEHPMWSKKEPTKVQNIDLAIDRVADVLKQYDFIVIVERLQESLVVLKLLLGLKTSDILYLAAKLSGGYSHVVAGPNKGCHLIAKSFISPGVATYLSSPEWYAQNYEDFLLYKVANRSLDLTIESLGRARFEKALAKYEKMMKNAEVCEGETVTPCSKDGVYNKKTDCYFRDWGCGYPCLDRLFGT